MARGPKQTGRSVPSLKSEKRGRYVCHVKQSCLVLCSYETAAMAFTGKDLEMSI